MMHRYSLMYCNFKKAWKCSFQLLFHCDFDLNPKIWCEP